MLDRTEEDIIKNWPNHFDCPLVSVRCTAFNHEKYIAECLEGFLIQETNFPFEVIVHEDASTDKTASIIREYEKRYPKIIKPIYETENQYSKQDGSFTRIINAHLTGKYIAMCEGDDYWTDPNKLQRQVDFLESNSDYSMIFHDAAIKNELETRLINSVYPVMKNQDYSATELFKKWTVPTASMLYRREALTYAIKNSKNILNGDIFLVEKCAHLGKVRCINEQMSVYRIQPKGVTWDDSQKIQRLRKYPAHFKAIKENFPLIEKNIVNAAISRSLICALKYENFPQKISYAIQSLYYSPKEFCLSFLKKLRKIVHS
ncbi:Glycosyltransferase involved in cell wall bisynthesis [Fibrobacter intestinalis]|uniref:Glycosyltransferase involved in cell wall bisynthesis n=1 Tax=Fibrobacter intestinalis TaxID=28122 RepID=A0A1M6PTA5_9BACT|nr:MULTISPECIES: glycosyltransferase [Fibrobacter]PBC68958.1 glycosyltransferase involved in cell wall bisynthesis [Fibrobacter sp. UWS1]SHK11145.1 Glycosyltransferase involved in cell wall bisynthesis [Fibrobacter intestinalis]